MKKILAVFAILMGLSAIPASAKTAPVQAMQDFSIGNPSQTLLIKMLANVKLTNDIMLHEGFYVLGQIQSTSNSGFVFVPVKFQNFHNDVYEIQGNFPAKFSAMIDKPTQNGLISKNAKFVLDFITADDMPQQASDEHYEKAENGISAVVNKTRPALYDGSIPQTMKDFPGIKLNSFDNGSNFNIPRKLMIQPDERNININDLKMD